MPTGNPTSVKSIILGVSLLLAIAACSTTTPALEEQPATPDAPVPPPSSATAAPSTTDPSFTTNSPTTSRLESGATWLKGQLHLHTSNSLDTSTPAEEMIRTYEELGFDFIVITDHVQTTDRTDHVGPMRVYVGVELSQEADVCDPRPHDPGTQCRIHVSSLFSATRPHDGINWAQFPDGSPLGVSKFLVETAQMLGGLPMINHPSQYWAVDGPLLIEQIRMGAVLVEIANLALPEWTFGTTVHPSPEAIWDEAALNGANIFGVATDDAHDPSDAGLGWVMVQAENTEEAIKAALRAGRFYSSSGVTLNRIQVTGTELSIDIDSPVVHTIEFIAGGGEVLATIEGTSASFGFPSGTSRMRAVVTSPAGEKAWTQFLSRES